MDLWIGSQQPLRFGRRRREPEVTAVAIGPNKSLAVAYDDNFVFFWSVPERDRNSVLMETQTNVTALRVLDNLELLTGHTDGYVRRWNGKGELLGTIEFPRESAIKALGIDTYGVLSVAYIDGRIIHRTIDGTNVGDTYLDIPSDAVAIALSEDGSSIVTAHENGLFVEWTASGFWKGERKLLLSVSITPALWTWITLVLVVSGCIGYSIISLRTLAGKPSTGSVPSIERERAASNPSSVTRTMKKEAEHVAALLSNPKTQGPLTLCLYGPWGSGKSTMVNLVAWNLRRRFSTCVFFDAWHHQDEDHLFAALIEQIMQSWRPSPNTSRFDRSQDTLPFLDRILIRVDNVVFYFRLWKGKFVREVRFFLLFFVMFVGGCITWIAGIVCAVASVLGSKVCEIGTTGDSMWASDGGALLTIFLLSGLFGFVIFLWNSPRNVFKAFPMTPMSLVTPSTGWFRLSQNSHQLSFRYRFQIAFRDVCDVLTTLNRRLVIVIDDLDRCDGRRIGQILEAVNFLTSSGNCYVILAMDEKHVRYLLDREFSDIWSNERGLSFSDLFLEKIINLSLAVPPLKGLELRELRRGNEG